MLIPHEKNPVDTQARDMDCSAPMTGCIADFTDNISTRRILTAFIVAIKRRSLVFFRPCVSFSLLRDP